MEKDRLLYTINRFDHYFESINNKTALYIAINTFILGSILAGYTGLEKLIKEYLFIFNTITLVIIFLGLLTLIMLVRASIPFVSKKSNSLLYFNSIDSISREEFISDSKKYNDKDELKDLRSQTYTLSQGLSKKFKQLQLCGQLLITQFIVLIPLIVIFLINKF